MITYYSQTVVVWMVETEDDREKDCDIETVELSIAVHCKISYVAITDDLLLEICS